MRQPSLWRTRLVFLSIGLTVLMSAQQKRPLTPEDTIDIFDLKDAQISPDGRQVAFVMRDPADPEKPGKARNDNIWIVPSDGSAEPRPFTASPKNDNMPRWSPDGHYLAFLSDREGSESQIWLMRTDGGDARKLTSFSTSVTAYRWSRDGQMIACIARDGPTDEDRKRAAQGDDAIEFGAGHKFDRLWVVGIGKTQPTLVTRRDIDVAVSDWSPNGSELVVIYTTPDRYLDGRIAIFRRSDGALVRELNDNASPEGIRDATVRWSPDGKSILFLENSPRKTASWMSVIPAAGGAARPLTKDFAGTVDDFFWAPGSSRIVAGAITGTRAKVLRVDPESGKSETAAELISPFAEFSMDATARTFAYVSETSHSPSEVWVKTGASAARRLTNFNSKFESIDLGQVTEVSWTNRKDGVKLNGVLVTPPGYQAGRRYPMIVENHPGNQQWWTGWQGSWWQWAQLLSARGYVVFLPNGRGVAGHGWKLAETIMDWGAALDDVLDGVDELVARKIADPERLGIGGWSNGGFMSAWTITHTDRFKAAVTYEPVVDMTLWWEKGGLLGYHAGREDSMGGTPTSASGAYAAHSPLTFAGACRTPVLILHGQREDVVPTLGSYAFYRELRSRGIDAALVLYPRGGHALDERAHQLDLLRRMVAWFDRYLKPK